MCLIAAGVSFEMALAKWQYLWLRLAYIKRSYKLNLTIKNV
jgi:hypothetical protein